MLSTTSGFTQDQAQRFRSMFYLLIAGGVILIFGLGILCFGRMYTFDTSNYDLFLVFGVIIVTIAIVITVVPVYCQLRIYLEVRRDAKDQGTSRGDYGPIYVPGTQAMAAAPAPYAVGSIYQHQAPFSTATYMMGRQQQQQQQQQMPQQPTKQRLDYEASLASDDTLKQQQSRQAPTWSLSDKQQPI